MTKCPIFAKAIEDVSAKANAAGISDEQIEGDETVASRVEHHFYNPQANPKGGVEKQIADIVEANRDALNEARQAKADDGQSRDRAGRKNRGRR